jgi:hypothetical protein
MDKSIECEFMMKYRTHETSRIRVVSADLAVHLNETLLNNRGDFTASQGILQPVAEEDGKRE